MTAAATATVDGAARLLLDEMQRDFPLIERPYTELGERAGLSEAEALARVKAARAAGLLRQVSAIYDTRALGYSSALVAMRVAPERLLQAAAVVSAHPGVSHNYQRNHDFNLWFTVAMPPGHDLDAVVARLHELTGAQSTRPMPTLKLFKIGVSFDLAGGRSGERASGARKGPSYSQERRDRAQAQALTGDDIAFIRVTQRDLPDVVEPFAPVAEQLGTDAGAVLERARRLIASGHMRRFAAIINHRRAGFAANGMVVWNVAAERVEQFGSFVASHDGVSHCYHRPTYEDWPYSVFSMLHGASVAEVEEAAAAISREGGVADYLVLYSSVEFKKIRLPYFVPEYEQWEALCAGTAQEQGLL